MASFDAKRINQEFASTVRFETLDTRDLASRRPHGEHPVYAVASTNSWSKSSGKVSAAPQLTNFLDTECRGFRIRMTIPRAAAQASCRNLCRATGSAMRVCCHGSEDQRPSGARRRPLIFSPILAKSKHPAVAWCQAQRRAGVQIFPLVQRIPATCALPPQKHYIHFTSRENNEVRTMCS